LTAHCFAMSPPPDKPLVGRLADSLARHGLSFGDALNVALFILTIASLFLAYAGVRIAKQTLWDARDQAEAQRKSAVKAGEDQEKQFQEQQRQLQKSSDSLDTAAGLLSRQNTILAGLQGISRRQLADLDASDARSRAKPLPFLTVWCQNLEVADSQKWAQRTTRHLHAHSFWSENSSMGCHADLVNKGNGDLRSARLEFWVGGCLNKEGNGGVSLEPFDSEAKVLGNTVPFDGLDIPPAVRFLDGRDIPPESTSGRAFSVPFTVRAANPCDHFLLQSLLESNNFTTIEMIADVDTKDRR
jgi:hypothetical protein